MRSDIAGGGPRAGRRPRWILVRSARLPVSTRVRVRTLVLALVACGAALAMMMWSLTLGSQELGPAEVVRALVGAPAEPGHTFIVHSVRLPRTLTAALVGAVLAVSGAVLQALVRNPLASPDVIGVNSGAGLVVVFTIVTALPAALIPVGAFAGATATAFIVYALTWRSGVSGTRLVLVGIGVNAAASALTTLLIVRYPVDRVSLAVWWQAGTLSGAEWADVTVLLVGVAVLLPVVLWFVRHAAVLQFGDDAARALGVRAELARTALLVAAAGFAALAVAAAGPIGFVALISPHIARMLAGPVTGGVLLFAAGIGACMLSAADLVARHAFPVALPVGVLTAAVGAPYFLFLLARTDRGR
ncbi:iron complex transport system permease protein [Lipingzhangella halophila]|uniref:Iron complex transport system permease protein n=1 Tax=Lipingzhangella halophila TaxID=1783352 RepID=A0A7W7W1Y7_9ACTN|nr:iron ABC transporter permease [Lipingzhangella halophila]MBB4931171.1 iron complex transport system permease protein [Lipingzhangella halophila]